MPMRGLAIILFVLLAVPGCGGTIGDLFGAFPADTFQPDQPDPGPGGPPPGGGAQEVAFLEAAQGVTGDVRNIALAQVGALSIVFLAAGTDGVHVADVTLPERVSASDYITTIRDAVLTNPAASLAGGRADAVAVVDNTYLVVVAVGSGAANAVSVFHIPTLLIQAASPLSDLSDAFVPKVDLPAPAPPIDIAAPGVAGKGGGVSGRAGTFAVATGGPELGLGIIVPGTPGTWTALPAFTSAAAPQVDNFVDVIVTLTGIFASVTSADTFGVISLSVGGGTSAADPPILTPVTPAPIDVEDRDQGGNFDIIINSPARIITGPGNYPMDLAVDITNLLVTGDNQVRLFDVTNPALSTPPAILRNTGEDTIAVSGSGGVFAVGAGDSVGVYTALTGQPILASSFEFTAINSVVRGVVLTSSAAGQFVLCCAGTRGLRIVQWSGTP